MRRLLLVIVLLLLAAQAFAQTSNALVWNYDAPLATVQQYQQSVSIDGANVSGAPVCIALAPSVTECAIPIGATPQGPHVYRVAAVAQGVEKSTTATIDAAGGPRTPSGLHISVTTIVTVQSQ